MDWRGHHQQAVARSKMTVDEVSLISAISPWGLLQRLVNVFFGRPDGKFFEIIGWLIYGAGREVPGWGQPAIREFGDGCVALLKTKGKEKFLCLWKEEPGNRHLPGMLALAAACSTSKSNLEKAHEGKAPPFAIFACSLGEDIWAKINIDGGKFDQKVNRYAVIEVDPDDPDIKAEMEKYPSSRWFIAEELREVRAAGLMGDHLAIVLSTYFL